MTASHLIPPRTYVAVFFLLLLLLAATVILAQFHFGEWNLILAMTVAVAKALLIVLYFMHIRYSVPLIQLAAGAGGIWLTILFVLMFGDYFTR